MTTKSSKILSVVEWAKKNGINERRVRRLIKSGVIPTKPYFVPIYGIEASFKLKK